MKASQLLVLGLCSTCLSFAGHQRDDSHQSPQVSFNRGLEFLNDGKWEEAGSQFRLALGADHSYRAAHELYQDVEYFYFEHTKRVFAEYADLLKRHPHDPLFHYLIARISTQKQRDSLGIFRSPLLLDSSFVPEYLRLVPSLSHQGKLEEAEALIEAGLRHSPQNIDLLLQKGYIYGREGRTSESSDIFHKMVQVYPESTTTIGAYLVMADRADSDSERIALLEQAVRLDTPGIRIDAHSELFELYAKANPTRAIQFARKAIHKRLCYIDRRLPSTLYGSLYTLYLRTDTTKAIEIAREVLGSTIRDPRMYLYFGNRMLSLKKDPDLAIKLLEKALSYHTPENVYGVSCFGRMTRTAIRRHCEEDDPYFRLGLGSAYYEKTEYLNALSMLQSGLDRNDQVDADLYHQIGLTYERLLKPENAIAAYIQSLSLREDIGVRSALEALASRETNLKIAIPAKHVQNTDSAIAEAQIPRTKKAPAFQLKDLDGSTVSSSSFRGKVLVLDFWATWCGPCVAELPKLQELFKKYERNPGVSVVAINTEVNDIEVKKFVNKRGYSFPVLMDKGTTADFDVQGIPALFVIDQTGMIRYRHEGYDPNIDFLSMLSKEIELILSMKKRE